MSKAKFEAFKTALHALCVEHGVRIWPCSDGEEIGVSDACDGMEPVDFNALYDGTTMSPDERAAHEAKIAAIRVQQEQEWRDRMVTWAQHNAESVAALQECADYKLWSRMAAAHARKQRKEDMRVSTDPNDPAFIDARPRKVWVGERLIEGWTVADEFRRVVITPEKVHHGAVLIERLPDAPKPERKQPEGCTEDCNWPACSCGYPQVATPEGDRGPVPIEQLPRVQQETRPAKRRR